MNLAVVHNLPAGGQMKTLYYQLKYLSKNHEIDLYTLSTANESFYSVKSFIRNYFVEKYIQPEKFPWSVLSIYFTLSSVYKKMAEKIDKGNYDAVLVYPCFFTQSPYILKYLKTRSIYICPEAKREFYESFKRVSNNFTYRITLPFRWPLKFIDVENGRHADKIVVNSKFSKRMIEKIYRRNTVLNYLGVDTKLFRPYLDFSTVGGVHSDTSEVSSSPSVLSVGEISPHKAHDFIIRSLALIPKKIRPSLYLITQGGSEIEHIKKLARESDVVLKIFLNIKDKELLELYRQAKVYLYAAINEPFGLTILEAITCGVSVVAVKEGGVPELINGEVKGYLTDRDEGKFSQAITESLNNPISNKEKNMQFEFIKKNWSWEKSVKEFEKIIFDESL